MPSESTKDPLTLPPAYCRCPDGLYDLSGNVWEWCADWYDSHYYVTSPAQDPPGPGSGSARAARGGSWGSGGHFLRASSRHDGFVPKDRDALLGFRLARSL